MTFCLPLSWCLDRGAAWWAAHKRRQEVCLNSRLPTQTEYGSGTPACARCRCPLPRDVCTAAVTQTACELPTNCRRPPGSSFAVPFTSACWSSQAARAGADGAGTPLLRVSPFAAAADKRPDVRAAVHLSTILAACTCWPSMHALPLDTWCAALTLY